MRTFQILCQFSVESLRKTNFCAEQYHGLNYVALILTVQVISKYETTLLLRLSATLISWKIFYSSPFISNKEKTLHSFLFRLSWGYSINYCPSSHIFLAACFCFLFRYIIFPLLVISHLYCYTLTHLFTSTFFDILMSFVSRTIVEFTLKWIVVFQFLVHSLQNLINKLRKINTWHEFGSFEYSKLIYFIWFCLTIRCRNSQGINGIFWMDAKVLMVFANLVYCSLSVTYSRNETTK